MRDSLSPHEQGLIIATSDFSKGARDEAKRTDTVPIVLINGDDFADLLIEYGVGVTRRSHSIVELDETADLTAGNQ